MSAVSQIGYMVHDLDAAIDFWIDVMQAGPFYLADIVVPDQSYRGAPTNAEISVAIGYSGDMQIELIKQTNAAPSAYLDGVPPPEQTPRAGHFHHFLMSHDGYDEACERFRKAGAERTFDGRTDGLGRYCYIDARDIMGCHIELMDHSSLFDQACRTMREAHRDWDGTDRRRSFETLLA